MRDPIRITRVRFTEASSELQRSGLLLHVSFVLNDALLVDGVAVRRARDGRTLLSFPSRRDAAHREHFILSPLDDATRREIERQVLEALERQGLSTLREKGRAS